MIFLAQKMRCIFSVELVGRLEDEGMNEKVKGKVQVKIGQIGKVLEK
jgi:hypothetical protein